MRRRATGLRPLAPRPRSQLSRPGLERLEDRTVLSGGLTGPTVQVNPAAYAAGQILVHFSPTGLSTLASSALPAGTHLGAALSLVQGLYAVRLDPGVAV